MAKSRTAKDVVNELLGIAEEWRSENTSRSPLALIGDAGGQRMRDIADLLGVDQSGDINQVKHDVVRTFDTMVHEPSGKTLATVRRGLAPSDAADLFVSAGEPGATAKVPDSLARAVGGQDRRSLIKAANKLNKDFGFGIRTAGATKATLVNEVLKAMNAASTTDAVPLGGTEATSMRGAGEVVRGQRAAARVPRLDPGTGEYGVAITPGRSIEPYRPGPGVGVPGAGDSGPTYTGTGRVGKVRWSGPRPAASSAGAGGEKGIIPFVAPKAAAAPEARGLAKLLGKIPKGVLKVGGGVLGALAVADLAQRVVGATQGRHDAERAARAGVGMQMMEGLGDTEELVTARGTARAGRKANAITREVGLGQEMDEIGFQDSELRAAMGEKRAELQQAAYRSEPGPQEYELALRIMAGMGN